LIEKTRRQNSLDTVNAKNEHRETVHVSCTK
jgi:hypothetical protein